MGASKVALDEPSTSNHGVAASSFTQPRPRQNFAAKLSLAKGSTSQAVRSCSVGGAAEAELVSSLSFSTEKERARETEVSCGPGSQNVSQPSGEYICIFIIKLAAAVPTHMTAMKCCLSSIAFDHQK